MLRVRFEINGLERTVSEPEALQLVDWLAPTDDLLPKILQGLSDPRDPAIEALRLSRSEMRTLVEALKGRTLDPNSGLFVLRVTAEGVLRESNRRRRT